jgi:predicted dehydrogenase
MNTKILIFGFGRMGLTHYAILNQLVQDTEFYFVDPDKKINYFVKRNLNAKIVNKASELKHLFNYALICTPPTFHKSTLDYCINSKIQNIFVEKPFGGISDDFSTIENHSLKITVGYVLRFNPIVQWVKNFIDIHDIEKVEGYYFSNTIEKKPKGWRNGLYSGVTNEVGSHLIDLSVFLFRLSNPTLINKKIQSVISDVDDIVTANFYENNIQFHFNFNWVNKEFRKPVFKFIITLKDGSVIKFDQQKLEHFKNQNLVNKITTVDLARNVPFYLRGIDFTAQMQDFIGIQQTMASVQEAMLTRRIINKLIAK